MPLKTPELTKFTTASPAVVSYSSLDILSRTGYQLFYLSLTTWDIGAGDVEKSILTTSRIEGGPSMSAFGVRSGTFDLSPFPHAVTIKGIATFTGQVHASIGDVMTASLWHVEDDGTTETLIGTEARVAVKDESPFSISFDVSEKLFASGEILRLKASSEAWFSADPSGTRPGDRNPSKLNVPFKIDI